MVRVLMAKIKEFWQSRFLKVVGILVVMAVAIWWVLFQGYSLSWTGFGDYMEPTTGYVRGKTLWDWLDLFIIPIFLALGAFYLNRTERAVEQQAAEDRAKLEREIATDRQQEAALQSYIDRMADLLLKENLRVSENEELRNVARIRTLTVLRGLDPRRKGMLLLFLQESGLITQEAVINLAAADFNRTDLASVKLGSSDPNEVRLAGANLSFANLSRANLNEVRLGGANLSSANLQNANLTSANLEKANLTSANLRHTDLTSADLSKADLSGANLGAATLNRARLNGANLSEASLNGVHLDGAELILADLTKATLFSAGLLKVNLWAARLSSSDLTNADLSGARLNYADLSGADLTDASLSGADLSQANLTKAKVSKEQLAASKSLVGAIMPDGTKHD